MVNDEMLINLNNKKRALHLTINKISKRPFSFFMVLAILFSSTSQSVASFSVYQQLQWPFYVSDTLNSACYPIGTETGDGPLFGLGMPAGIDPATLADRINKFIKDTRPGSPLIGTGGQFVTAGQHFNVNPAMMVGIAYKESTLGTASEPVVYNNHNSFGISGNNPPQEQKYPVVNSYVAYPSFEASTDGASDYVSASYIKSGATYPSKTILEMMKHYTPPSPEKDTKITLGVMHKILDGLPPTSSSTAANSTAASSSLDLDAIAKKYGLHSAMVKQLGGPVLGTYNADQPPNQPASVMKLIIAHVFLEKHPHPEDYATTFDRMLHLSLNDAPNKLIRDIDGTDVANSVAKSLGYNDTVIDYYDPEGDPKYTKTATVSDLTKAMESVYTGSGPGYSIAQEALRASSNDGIHFGLNSEANKWGYVSDTTGNSAIFSNGASKYIITIYVNGPSGSESSESAQKLKSASNEIFDVLKGNPSITPGSPSTNGCQGSFTGGANGFELSQMVSYEQFDKQWSGESYGTGRASIAESGCGPTSLAMIGATLLGDKSITPLVVAKRYGDTYHVTEGTSWGLMSVFAKDYGLKFKDLGKDLGEAAQIIRSGGLVLISVDGAKDNPGYFTSSGHLMVIRAVTADGAGFYLADPNGDTSKNDIETRAFSPDFLIDGGRDKGQMLHLWGYYR